MVAWLQLQNDVEVVVHYTTRLGNLPEDDLHNSYGPNAIFPPFFCLESYRKQPICSMSTNFSGMLPHPNQVTLTNQVLEDVQSTTFCVFLTFPIKIFISFLLPSLVNYVVKLGRNLGNQEICSVWDSISGPSGLKDGGPEFPTLASPTCRGNQFRTVIRI